VLKITSHREKVASLGT